MKGLPLAMAAVLAAGSAASAQAPRPAAYPQQTVRFLVPFSAGSITDILARAIGDRLSEMWRQQVIVENRPGVAGTTAAAKSGNDGYTLMLTSNGHTVVGSLNKNLSFDPVKDFVGITQVATVPLVLVAPATLPAADLKGLIALAKAGPGTLNFASSGLGSTAYISAELFRREAGIDIVHVPYKGAPEALTGVMRGDAHIFFAGSNVASDLVQAGKIKAIAITPQRVAALPDLPTLAEAGLPAFNYDAWFGIMAPSGTPRAVIDKVSADVARVLDMPEMRAQLLSQGVVAVTSTPDKFDELIRSDTERLGKLFGEAPAN